MEITGVHVLGSMFGVGKFQATREQLFDPTFLEEVGWTDNEMFFVPRFDLKKFLEEHQGEFVYVVYQTDSIDDDDEIETTFSYRWFDEQGVEVTPDDSSLGVPIGEA
jgi:hypothetical protein